VIKEDQEDRLDSTRRTDRNFKQNQEDRLDYKVQGGQTGLYRNKRTDWIIQEQEDR
jgi:hypothetical protein